MAEKPCRADMVDLAAQLGPRLKARAGEHDRDASFPFENYDDLREAGLLRLCIPAEHGGLGGTFADYIRVSEELGRHCGSTALTFNMHTMTTIWVGEIADLIDMPGDARLDHESRRAEVYRGIVEQGLKHSQPISEVTPDSHRNPSTVGELVDGGFVVTGRKIFASLAGAADFYDTTCQVPGEASPRFVSIPADSAGVSVEGEWDPLGMRATVSRTLVFDEVFVPSQNELLPPGVFAEMHQRYPYPLLSITATYLGIMRGVLDFTCSFLRGEYPGGPTQPRRDSHQKQDGWARMQLLYHQARALLHTVVDDGALNPTRQDLARMWSASWTVMENAAQIAALGVRVCGGQAISRRFPLERMYRDARLGAVMLPFTAEVCLDRLGREFLFDD
jgi:alkylation response protein AidB-like acyl-CoA dehydrogenase